MAVYHLTRSFPKEEFYGLTSQTRRASQSVAANIAEGCGRDGAAELAPFLHIATGSASELEYHLLLAKDLKFVDDNAYEQLGRDVTDLKRMLTVFVRKLTAEG